MRHRVVREGLGYRLDIPNQGVSIAASRLRESSGDVTAELFISRAPDLPGLTIRHNLLSPTTRGTLARSLGARTNHFDWNAALEELAMGVLELERQGEPWVRIGHLAPRERPPYLLRPFIYEHKPTILFGMGGIGKSTVFAGAMAVAVATGRTPFPEWVVSRTGPVLILDWEGEPEDWNDAIVAICDGLGIEVPDFDYRTCRGPLETQTNAIAERVERVGAALVIIDSAEAAMRSPRDSGSDDPAKRFYDALRLIPCAALVIDHVSKSQIEHGGNGGPIGNVTKQNRARATWEVRATAATSEDGTNHVQLINRKNNLDRTQPSIGIAWIRSEGAIRMWAEDIVPVPRRKDGRLSLWERCREVLASGVPLSAPELVGALSLSGKDPVRQVENAMARHPDIFAHGDGSRLVRPWYLLEGAADAPVTGQIIAFPGTVQPPAPVITVDEDPFA